MIQREQGIRSNEKSSSEVSEAAAEKKQGKNFKAHRATTLSQRKCHICGSENHLQEECRRGNQQAIDAGKAAAPQLVIKIQEIVPLTPGEKIRAGKNQPGLWIARTMRDMHHAEFSAKSREFLCDG